MSHILLCPNAHKDAGLAFTQRAAALLRENGHEVFISPFLSDGLEDTWAENVKTVALADGLRDARLVVTLGGDGTILQISSTLARASIPILGINMGNKGFLAEVEQKELSLLLAAAEGRYTVQPRMMLDVALIRAGETVYKGLALNEACVRSLVNVIRVEAFGDGREITAFSGDGIIVSTPTGSTAYSMAAGGPIVEPDADCIILTPICTFRLAARSYVLTADRKIVVRTEDQGSKEVMLSIDGETVSFSDGDELRVSRSPYALLMAHVTDRSFYDIVFEKLNDKR